MVAGLAIIGIGIATNPFGALLLGGGFMIGGSIAALSEQGAGGAWGAGLGGGDLPGYIGALAGNDWPSARHAVDGGDPAHGDVRAAASAAVSGAGRLVASDAPDGWAAGVGLVVREGLS